MENLIMICNPFRRRVIWLVWARSQPISWRIIRRSRLTKFCRTWFVSQRKTL